MPAPTKLLLAGLPLDVPSFSWVLLPGSSAYTFNIDCWPAVDKAIGRLGIGPHTLVAECPSLHGLRTLTVRNVYLRDERPVDEVSKSWRISDRRMWLDYAKFTGRFNLRHKVNDREALDPQGVFGFNNEAYRPYSAFSYDATTGATTANTSKLWTALLAIKAILKDCDPSGVDAQTFANVTDNGIPLESKTYIAERPVVILPDLLRLAEVSMYVSLDGYYRFFDRLVPTEQTKAYALRDFTRGRIIRQNNKRTRPSEVHVYFIEEREEIAEYIETEMVASSTVFTNEAAKTEYDKIAQNAGLKVLDRIGTPAQKEAGGGQGGQAAAPRGGIPAVLGPAIAGVPAGIIQAGQGKAGRAGAAAIAAAAAAALKQVPKKNSIIQLENVIQIPRNISVEVPGAGLLEFTAGEWLRFDLALATWYLTDIARARLPMWFLTYATIQKYWFGNVLEAGYTFDKTFPTWHDPELVERVNAVREHYRRTFRIAKPWLDNMHSWSASRVTLVDPITRTRSLPFVAAQYCNVPNLRPPVGAGLGARVMAYNVDDFSSNKYSPFVFTAVDADLGLLQLEPITDRTNVIRERIRGQVNDIPSYDLSPDGSILWQRASLNPEHKLRISISVIWGAPNNKQVLYPIKKDFKKEGGQAGVLEIFSTIDSARIDKDGKVVNADLLDRIADYETRQVMFSHRDVGIGYFHYTGFRTQLAPEGFSRGVSFVIEDGVAYTMADFTEPYSNRPSGAAMDIKTREFAFRIAPVR